MPSLQVESNEFEWSRASGRGGQRVGPRIEVPIADWRPRADPVESVRTRQSCPLKYYAVPNTWLVMP